MALQPLLQNPRQPPGALARGPVASVPVPVVEAGGAMLMVGPGIRLKGQEITDCEMLVVEGSLEVSMQARVLRIAEGGSFKGEATVDTAEVRGRFEGALTVRQKLVVHASGRVAGRVSYGSLVIEEGAELAGEVERAAGAAVHGG